MIRLTLAAFILTLAALACQVPSVPRIFVTTPTVPPTATPAASATPTRTWTESVQTIARVLPSAVNIRKSEGGDPTGKYLYAGDTVVILSCRDRWCRVVAVISGEEVVGYVFRGCLSNVAEALLCEAR